MAEKRNKRPRARSRAKPGAEQSAPEARADETPGKAADSGAGAATPDPAPDQPSRTRRRKQGKAAKDERPRRAAAEPVESEVVDEPSRGGGVGSMAREHPVAALLIGAAAGLAAVGVARRASAGGTGGRAKVSDDGAGETNGNGSHGLAAIARDSFTSAAERSRARVSEAADSARDSAARAAGSALEGLARRGKAARAGAARALESGRDVAGRVWENHPLAVCIGALAVGAAAALLLPATVVENSMIGRTSDQLAGRGKAAGRAILERGKSVAGRAIREAVEAIASEAEREGLSPARIGRKVRRIATRVSDVVANAVDADDE